MKNAKKMLAPVLATLLLLPVAACGGDDNAQYAKTQTVAVEGGTIKGALTNDEAVAVFKGIPYAAAPVGELRWKAPQSVASWEGELDCTLWGANALQGDASVFDYWTQEFVQDTDPAHYRDGVIYSEDCLTLNVWSSCAVTKDKPVLVFIHGGGYNSGGASCEVYDGANIASDDVVFVSVQYRVGALGYLATQSLVEESENSSSGNYGLLDQIAALKWVKNNIAKFGGNPDNVTVMGQSAGAGSVNAIITSPLSKGLFKRAVAASHNGYQKKWQTLEEKCNSLSLSYNGKALKDMTCEELRAIPSSELKGKTVSGVGPCIDGYALNHSYIEALSTEDASPVPLMTGNVGRDDLLYDFWTSSANNISCIDTMITLQNAISKARADGGVSEETYVYMFDYPVPAAAGVNNTSGARHSYDLAYFFGNFSTASGRQWTQADRDLSAVMKEYLINFCIDGDPRGTDEQFWDCNDGTYGYMNFGTTTEYKKSDVSKAALIEAHYGIGGN